MKTLYKIFIPIFLLTAFTACVEQDFVEPKDGEEDSLFVLLLDANEGGTYESETDYKLEIKFEDYIGELPDDEIVLIYQLTDASGFDIGDGDNQLNIKEVIYEIDDCNEGELAYTFNSGEGTISITPDAEIGMPESFEVVFNLPFNTVIEDGEEEEEAIFNDDIENEERPSFSFEVTGISSSNERIQFSPITTFEFELLDDETITTEWVLDISDEAVFNVFKEAFSPVSAELSELVYEEISEIKFEFEYEEMAIKIELVEEEEDECEAGEFEAIEVEIEAEFEAEDGELVLEGSYFVFNEDDGEPEEELDFILEAGYSISVQNETLIIQINSLIDEDNYGEEAFYRNENGAYSLTLVKD